MKKVICLVLCLMLAFPVIGSASEEDGIMVCYEYINNLNVNLKITAGTAIASGKSSTKGKSQTSVTVRLQKSSDGEKWATIATWKGTKSSGISEASGTKTLTSGYSYRVWVNGKVYDSDGTVLESANKYSSVQRY